MTANYKCICLLILLIPVASGPLLIQTISADIPEPSVPEFSLNYVDRSVNVPPTTTTTTDPFTGKQADTITGGYYEDRRLIEFKITNQQFVASGDSNAALYYNIRFKGHFEENWHYMPDNGNYNNYRFFSSNLNETVIDLLVTDLLKDYPFSDRNSIFGGQMDFQVQAFIGDEANRGTIIDFIGQASDWSNTQTIVIAANSSTSTSPSSQPTPTPSSSQNPTVTPVTGESVLFGLGWWQVVLLAVVLVVILLVCVVVFLLRRCKTSF
jgi:hypothetical protein